MTLVPPHLSVYAVHIVVMFILCNEISNEHETKCVVGYGVTGVCSESGVLSPEEADFSTVW